MDLPLAWIAGAVIRVAVVRGGVWALFKLGARIHYALKPGPSQDTEGDYRLDQSRAAGRVEE